jgi:TolB-like protein/Tfp pilus assembly protein PilF
VTDDAAERGAEGTWERLRRRKVVQWGLAYVAGAWGFLQGLEYVGESFHWPSEIRQVALLAFLVGLPVVIVIAWYHGDRGEQRVSGTELGILTLLFVLAGGIFWRYQHAIERATAVTPPATAESKDVRSGSVDPRPTLAVLPFENRSDQEKDAFFVDGIHDDILTQLTKIGSIKVIARTSVEQFRGTKLTVREIGEQLGVTTVLEGGVQRAGERVRVTVQLIDTATDAHVWAENYDRELSAANIFAIQSEVATAIAAAMKAVLTASERANVNLLPTQNLPAWEAYQLGRQRLAKRTVKDLNAAREFFQRAIDLDPNFAQAHAGLADTIWLKADVSGEPIGPATLEAESIIRQALELNPELPEAITTLAKFAQERREYDRAEAGYRRAIALNPNYPTAHQWYAQLLWLRGRDAEAANSLQRAVELDPLSLVLQASLAWTLSGQGRFDLSLARFDRAREIDPLSPLPYVGIGTLHATAFGRLDAAVPFLEKAMELDVDGGRPEMQLAQLYLDLGDHEQAKRWSERAAENLPANAVRQYQSLYAGDRTNVVALARQAIALDPRDWRALALLRDADLQANDAELARLRYAHAFPELLSEQLQAVDVFNYNAAVDLALVLQQTGENARATRLLDLCALFLTSLPRLGPWGFAPADVQIHALKGDMRAALTALRAAVTAGWRGPYWRYYRDFDPALAAIRAEPEFSAAFGDIERDMARQRAVLAARPHTRVAPPSADGR